MLVRMSIITRSPLATMVTNPQNVTDRKVVKAWGVCIHTTGSGLPTKAAKLGIDPVDLAIQIYTASDANFPHYVCGYDGRLVQIADEKERARHAGISTTDRGYYLSGAWRRRVSPACLALWDKKWGLKSPLGLFPSKSPNEDYIGVETIPLLKPLPSGSLFTDDQYIALSALVDDIGTRHAIVVTGKRLVAHEDLEPLTRWNMNGYGWDPGGLSNKPRFLWSKIEAPLTS